MTKAGARPFDMLRVSGCGDLGERGRAIGQSPLRDMLVGGVSPPFPAFARTGSNRPPSRGKGKRGLDSGFRRNDEMGGWGEIRL